MFAQGSTQAPTRQARPCGQTTLSQGPTHWPAMHFSPSVQVTSRQVGSTQTPLGEHTLSSGQTNSPPLHLGTQVPLSQISLSGQRSPSSGSPLQSLSSPSHFSPEG